MHTSLATLTPGSETGNTEPTSPPCVSRWTNECNDVTTYLNERQLALRQNPYQRIGQLWPSKQMVIQWHALKLRCAVEHDAYLARFLWVIHPVTRDVASRAHFLFRNFLSISTSHCFVHEGYIVLVVLFLFSNLLLRHDDQHISCCLANSACPLLMAKAFHSDRQAWSWFPPPLLKWNEELPVKREHPPRFFH